jgi:acetyl esterase
VPLHPQAEALLAKIDAFGDPPIEESTPDAVRALRRARLRPPTFQVEEIRDLDCHGVPGRLYRPSSEPGLGLLVFLHGGGWVLGDLDTHDNFARGLAALSGHAVLAVDYRLAPEHPFPAGLDDAFATTRWAYDHASELGCDPERLAIGGDSAGANLAAVVAHDRPVPLRLQLLVYPVLDARCTSPSYDEFRDGPYLTAAGMRWFVEHYLSGGQGSREDPRVSPVLADDETLAGSPPALVVTVEHDPLRDEGEAYAGRLRALGVPTSATRYEGMFHGFLSFADLLDDGRVALEEAAATLRAALDP